MKFLAPLVLALVLAAPPASCGGTAQYYRYKLVIELLVNGEIKNGSTVVELVYEVRPTLQGGTQTGTGVVKGEALFIDLGPGRRPLVATLHRGPANSAASIPTALARCFRPMG